MTAPFPVLSPPFGPVRRVPALSGRLLRISDPPLKLDLQRFAKDSPTGARTEAATDKRRREAREKGQVAKSMDLITALVLIAGFSSMYLFAGFMMKELEGMMRFTFSEMRHWELSPNFSGGLVRMYMEGFSLAFIPIGGSVLFAALVGNLVQIGFLVTAETVTPKIEKLNPIEGFKRIFSLRSIVELIKSLAKLVIVGYMPYREIVERFGEFYNMVPMQVQMSWGILAELIFKISMEIGFVLLILGLIDYGYQKWEYEESLKMSKYDVRKERKETEGDPKIKGEIRRRQMEMAFKRMMSAVPEAAVVITNPTHYAVALKYDFKNGAMDAPEVVAKGKDLIAQRIKEIAGEHDIPIHRDPPLARELFRLCEVGDVIPEELYHSVVEVFIFVLNLSRKEEA